MEESSEDALQSLLNSDAGEKREETSKHEEEVYESAGLDHEDAEEVEDKWPPVEEKGEILEGQLSLKEVEERTGRSIHTHYQFFKEGRRISVPACCPHGCMVTPEAKCSHGYPSCVAQAGLLE